jgi:hypothetical protein
MWRSLPGAPNGKTPKQDRRGSTDWVRSTTAVLIFGLGVALLALAIPRAIAAVTFARQSTLNTMIHGGHPSAAELADAVAVTESALRWASPAQYLASLSLFEYELVLVSPSSDPDRATWIGRAEQHAIAAVRANPADGDTWVRLAFIRQARGASQRDILDPLITSLDVAPNRRQLWKPRMAMLMYYWAALKPNELPIVRHQIRTMWNAPANRFFLYDTALTYYLMPRLKEILGGDPEAMEEIATFDRNMAYP